MKSPLDPDRILDNIQDGLLIVDISGRVLWINQVFSEMLGRSEKELVGLQCCDLGMKSFCRDHCPARRDRPDPESVDSHFNVHLEPEGGRGKPGSYCFVTSPIRDADGKITAYLENFRGMDRVRDMILELEEYTEVVQNERKKTDDLLDSLADGVFAVDEKLRIRRFSSNMEKMLGIPAEAALGKHCSEVLRGTLCESDCPLAWSGSHGKPVTGCRETLTAHDGTKIPVRINTGIVHNDPDLEHGLFGVVNDRREVENLRREIEDRVSPHGMIGTSDSIRSLFKQIQAVAPTEATVLIAGESGTGKELVARALHQQSQRANGPFVSVNCAALVHELLESELFGHVRGAFTGAVRDRMGRFVQAHGGTLFLDEIGDMSQALQAKLLRAIQEKTIEPVGSESSRKINVRIVAATNKDLVQAVQDGTFREDLYYRLNVIPVRVPPLRERKDDIPLLVNHFIEKYRTMYGDDRDDPFEGVSERALALMQEYDWPGNVRELEHAVEYAIISSDRGRIERAFLPGPVRGLTEPPESRAVPEAPVVSTPAHDGGGASTENSGGAERERMRLLEALEANHWNVGRTAESMGISRTTLWRRMRLHHVRSD